MLVPWHVELFGGLRISQPDRAITRFRSRKTGGLLAYLAFFRDRRHARDVLVEQFWPEADPEAGRHSLAVSINSLRRQLEPPSMGGGIVLVSDRTSVGVNPLVVSTDVAQFEAALAVAASATTDTERFEALTQAADLYRGALLPGYYEPWVLPQMLRLEELYFRAVRRLIRLHEDRSQHDLAVEHARRAASFDPSNESIQTDLARLLMALGRKTEALTIAHALLGNEGQGGPRRRAVRSSGAPRRAAVQARGHEQIAPAPAISKGSAQCAPRLPLRLTRFFGRCEELRRLSVLLSRDADHPRLITVTGTGGCGKTRLALEAADRVEADQPGSVSFVPLGTVSDAASIPATVADALRVPRRPQDDPLAQILQHLNNTGTRDGHDGHTVPRLLVLDNFEHLIEAGTGIVRSILEGASTLTCLVTSRQPLGLEGERLLPVGPLGTPADRDPSDGGNCAQLMEYPSLALFVDRAQAVRPDFQMTPRNAAAVARLCEGLEGIPLAIELAAARIGLMTPAQMVAGLEQRFEMLVSRRRDSIDRHRAMRSAIDWSYRLLLPELRLLFARLSVFRGGWTLEAAAEVCAEPHILDRLDELRAGSLITAEAGADGMRFGMLETLREFAGEQVPARERNELAARHLEWCLRLVERPQGGGPAREPGLEFDNCRAALAWCLRLESGATQEGLRLASAMDWGLARPDWRIRGSMTEARRWLEALLARDGNSSRALRAKALGQACRLSFWQGDHPAATRYADERLDLIRAIGDEASLAEALQSRMAVAIERVEYELVETLGAEGLELCQRLGDLRRMGMTLIALGEVARIQRDHPRARLLFEEAMRCTRETDVWEFAYSVTSLAYILLHQDERDRALELLKDALAIWRDAHNAWGVSIGLVAYAGAILDADPECTARLFGAAEATRAQIGYPMQTADRADYEVKLAALRETLDEVTLAALWAEGKAMTWQGAVAHALGDDRK